MWLVLCYYTVMDKRQSETPAGSHPLDGIGPDVLGHSALAPVKQTDAVIELLCHWQAETAKRFAR